MSSVVPFDNIEIFDFGTDPTWRRVERSPTGNCLVEFEIHRAGPIIRRMQIVHPKSTQLKMEHLECVAFRETRVSSEVEGFCTQQFATNVWFPFLKSGANHNMGRMPYHQHLVFVSFAGVANVDDLFLRVEFGFT